MTCSLSTCHYPGSSSIRQLGYLRLRNRRGLPARCYSIDAVRPGQKRTHLQARPPSFHPCDERSLFQRPLSSAPIATTARDKEKHDSRKALDSIHNQLDDAWPTQMTY